MPSMRKLWNVSGTVCLTLCAIGMARADVKSSSLNVEQTTEVPGGQLKPGTYTIGVVGSLTDRVVLHIDDSSGKTRLTFLGVSKPSTAAGSGSHAVQWNSEAGHKHFLRGYDFGSDYIEFVYPKLAAVAIAKANNVGVVAIDPASENRPELKNLTSQDRQMVTLWMLTPVEVGPSHGIEAKHYLDTQVATTTSATPVGAPAPTRAVPASAAKMAPPPTQIAELHKPTPYQPKMKRLPQTASQLPLLFLLGAGSIFAASTLRLRKWMA